MFCIPSFDEMTNLTPYFNHVIPAYAGIQTVSHSASQVEEISETGSYANPFLRFEQESGFLSFRKPSNNVVNYGYRTLVVLSGCSAS